MSEELGNGVPEDLYDDDDIEILEVVGVEEGDEAGEPDEDDEHEVVLSFDEDCGETGLAATATASARPETADERASESERLLRLQADLENFEKRVARERAEFERQATGGLVSRLLPIVDNFERALDHNTSDPSFREGVELIHRQLLDELRREGLEPIVAVGQPFDPQCHEAVETEAGDASPDTVTGEFQRGYRFHGRLLRPALVKVCTGPGPDGDDGSDESAEEGP